MPYYTLEYWDNGEISSQSIDGNLELSAKSILAIDGIEKVEIYEERSFTIASPLVATFT